MRVHVNGTETDLPDGSTVLAVAALRGVGPTDPGVAVAVDGHVVRRATWATTPINDGAVVEIVRAAAGG